MMSFDDEALIQLVRDFEPIYNKHHAGYKYSSQKHKKWSEIAKKLDSTVKECIERWKVLRERYSREMCKEKAPSGRVLFNQPQWHLFESMDFLRMHVAPRVPRRKSGRIERISTDVDCCPSEDGNEFPSPAPPLKETSNPAKKTQMDAATQAFTEGMATFQKYMQLKTSTKTEGQLFGETVAGLFDSLPSEQQKVAKVAILKCLLACEEGKAVKVWVEQ